MHSFAPFLYYNIDLVFSDNFSKILKNPSYSITHRERGLMLELHQGPELLQSIAILSLKQQDPKQQVCNNIFCSTRILLYKINKLVGLANPNYCPVVQRGFPELLDIHLYFFIGIFGFLITFFFHDLITGEEELQLQLALAMSREEAEVDENKSKSDDMRLQLALQKSKEEGGTKV